MGFLRSIASGVVATDRAQISLTPAIRVAIVITITIGISLLTHQSAVGTNAAIGMLLVGLADPSGSYFHRSRALIGTLVAMTIAVTVGCLIADHQIVHLIVVMTWAFGAGLISALGPRAAVAGVFSLVLIVVYSGTAVPPQATGRTVAAVGAGEVAMLLVIMMPWLLRRAAGSRAQFAVFFRGEAPALRRGPKDMAEAVHIERLNVAEGGSQVDQHAGAALAWFDQLSARARNVRLSILALAAVPSESPDAALSKEVHEFRLLLADASQAVARTLVWPVRLQNLSIIADRLYDHVEALRGHVSGPDMREIDAAAAAMGDVLDLLIAPWPLGRKNGVRLRFLGTIGHFAWKPHLHWSDSSFRHGARLAIAIGVAVCCTDLLAFSHDYWVALTVAWIAKPGLGDMVLRVASRLVGTVLGAALTLLVFAMVQPDSMVSVVLLGATVMVAVLFMTPNYSLCIAAITMFVLVLFGVNQESLSTTVPNRLVGTLVGGAIVLAASLLWPVKQGDNVCHSLTDLAQAIDALVSHAIVHGGSGLAELPAAERVRDARVRATHTIASSAHEPGHHVMATQEATHLLATLTEISTRLMQHSVRGIDDGARARLRRTHDEIQAILRHLEDLGAQRVVANAKTAFK